MKCPVIRRDDMIQKGVKFGKYKFFSINIQTKGIIARSDLFTFTVHYYSNLL